MHGQWSCLKGSPHSEKVENLSHAVSLHFLYHNFCRPHKALNDRTTALAAGLAVHRWEILEIVALIEAYERLLLTLADGR